MLRKRRKRSNTRAPIFAALGDETRLSRVSTLSDGQRRSNLTRQAITKHRRVLEGVGILRSVRVGRESLYEFNHKPIDEVKQHPEMVSAEWDRALGRLKSIVEAKPDTPQI